MDLPRTPSCGTTLALLAVAGTCCAAAIEQQAERPLLQLHMPELHSLQGFNDTFVSPASITAHTVLLGPNYQLQQTHK